MKSHSIIFSSTAVYCGQEEEEGGGSGGASIRACDNRARARGSPRPPRAAGLQTFHTNSMATSMAIS